MATICKYCNEPENKQDRPGLICEACICFVHLSCLRRPGTPGDFSCDVFFSFTCKDCSPTQNEIFERNKFQWVNVILLTFHHLTTHSYGMSNRGFFHYKTHICSFIDRNWNQLFGTNFKQKKNWIGTIAGALSVYNNLLFHSGLTLLQESGWWRLMHHFSPAVAAHIVQELARDKPKWRARNQLAPEQYLFIEKVTEMGYKELLRNEEDLLKLEGPVTTPVPCKKAKRSDSEDKYDASGPSYFDSFSSEPTKGETLDDSLSDNSYMCMSKSYSDMDSIFRGMEFTPANPIPPSDTSSIHSFQQFQNYDSDSRSRSPYQQQVEQSDENEEKPAATEPIAVKKEKEKEKAVVVPLTRETLFSKELNSIDMPWLEPEIEYNADVVPLSEYEEVQLLKKVENLIPKVTDVNKKSYLRRFRAKLAVRRLKRHKQLPLFDFDKTVKLLGGYVTDIPKALSSADRVLDRFQRSYMLENLSGTIASTNYGTALASAAAPARFPSPYSGAALAPYIRRDARAAPLWLRLTDELLTKTNRKTNPTYTPPRRATIDYSYIRPHHMAAVNNLCAQFFWPGVDLSEALQYPEFSCVVMYKKLVIGFALLVPDVSHTEAYISFIMTRPEWRRAGIGSFMLYHLLQTCTGKDVTLHVSPTNPAIFLYQKFGFKVEELIQDFYEKYYDIDYKECRHALFLRLVR